MTHQFDTEIAEKVGVNAAILYENIKWWCAKNEANETNFFDGKYWTFNSIKAWHQLFPYLTGKQIRTAITKLEDEGYIVSGNYNQSPYDRTKWYSLSTKIDLPTRSNENDQQGEPIPDNKPDNKPDNTPIPPTVGNQVLGKLKAKRSERVETAKQILDHYSKNVKTPKRKQSAINNIARWLEDHSKDELVKAIDHYRDTIKATEKRYIKECSNFFGVKGESLGFFKDFIEQQEKEATKYHHFPKIDKSLIEKYNRGNA